MGGGVRPTRMTPPIANAANVTARTRRRRGSSALFRAALVLALAISCAFAAPLVIASFRSALSPGGGPAPSHQTASQAVMNGLESGACMGFDPAGGRAAKTVFIARSEERRVGKEGRSRWAPYHQKKKRSIRVRSACAIAQRSDVVGNSDRKLGD